jgi:rubrerythrin
MDNNNWSKEGLLLDLNVGLDYEKAAYRAYAELAGEVENAEHQAILSSIATDEQEHIAIVEKMIDWVKHYHQN